MSAFHSNSQAKHGLMRLFKVLFPRHQLIGVPYGLIGGNGDGKRTRIAEGEIRRPA